MRGRLLLLAGAAVLLPVGFLAGGGREPAQAPRVRPAAAAMPKAPPRRARAVPAPAAGTDELSSDDVAVMDRALERLTEPCREAIPELGLLPPVNLRYTVTVGVARGRARVLRVEVADSTSSPDLAQEVPSALRDCLVDRLRTQEWPVSASARDQVLVHLTGLNWR